MFETEKSTGTGYTTTLAFLILAVVFSPAALMFFRPVGYLSVGLAVACSAACIALAVRSWKTSSQLSIPSIETPFVENQGVPSK
jgi:membrane associated rhomboid family serine protease